MKVGTNRREVFQGKVEAGHQLFQPFAEKGQQAIAPTYSGLFAASYISSLLCQIGLDSFSSS